MDRDKRKKLALYREEWQKLVVGVYHPGEKGYDDDASTQVTGIAAADLTRSQ